MKNKEIENDIKMIKTINKQWKTSFIKILESNKCYYPMGGYYITIVKFKYRSKKYELRDDIIDTFICEC